MTVSRKIAAHLVGTRYEDLPEAAVRASKQVMLDTLAVAWAGSAAPGSQSLRHTLAGDGGDAQSTLWADGGRLPAPATAFVNSVYASALDFDSMGRESPSHVSTVVLPAALALAEKQRCSGRHFLAAITLGADLVYRIGASCQAAGKPHKGWIYTSIHGVFGSAAACAKLLGMDEASTSHALGIASVQAAGTQQVIVEPSLTKRMLSAFAARAGVFSALLAQNGMTGPNAVFDGKFGLYAMYQDGNVERLVEQLGERFENDSFAIKKYPSCGANHTAIEGALLLAAEHDLAPAEIEAIDVTISPFMHRLVGAEFNPAGDAQAAAQFSIQYSIACAIIRRKFGVAEIEEQVIHDSSIGALARKVKVIVDDANRGTRGPMVLRVVCADGRIFSCQVDHEPGSIQSPLTTSEMAAKCHDCFALGGRPLSPDKIALLMRRVEDLEVLDDMSTFFSGVL